MTAALECAGVTKEFGGLVALRDVTFSVQANEIYAIVGPNGAGKTTLFEVISGFSPATRGTVRLAGREIQRLRPDQIARAGIARSFQTPVAFRSQTVLMNALVGAMFGSGSGNPASTFRHAAVERALDALEYCDLLGRQGAMAASLSVYELKRLMLATALAAGASVYLLDEPFGGLNPGERAALYALIRRLRERSATVIMIEHVMRAVQELADRMLVLHHGEKILEGTPEVVLREKRMIEVYLGESPGAA